MALNIIIDPGHVLNYNKGVAVGYYEGNKMFTLAYYLKEELEKYRDVNTFVSRNALTDYPSLAERGKLVNKHNATVFLSLHSNAISDQSRWEQVAGTLIYRSTERPNSVELANKLIDAIVEVMRPDTGVTYNRGVYTRAQADGRDYYGVLRNAAPYSVCEYPYIIEHGFHTNSKECSWMNNDANLRKIAIAEARVIAEYFGKKLVSEPVVHKTPYIRRVTIQNDTLNIRSGMTVNDPVIGQLPTGAEYVVVEENGNWGKLATGGYTSIVDAYSEFVGETTIENVTPTYGDITIPSGNFEFKLSTDLNIREGASVYYNTIGNVLEGATVTVTKLLMGWGLITYENKTGYIRIYSKYGEIPPVKTLYYKVQLGAYSSKANAERCKNTAVSKGFTNAYIVTSGGMYRVQIGSYTVKANAEELAARAKSEGLDVYINTVYA